MTATVELADDRSARFRTFKTTLMVAVAKALDRNDIVQAILEVQHHFRMMKANAPEDYRSLVSDINAGRNEDTHRDSAIACLSGPGTGW